MKFFIIYWSYYNYRYSVLLLIVIIIFGVLFLFKIVFVVDFVDYTTDCILKFLGNYLCMRTMDAGLMNKLGWKFSW